MRHHLDLSVPPDADQPADPKLRPARYRGRHRRRSRAVAALLALFAGLTGAVAVEGPARAATWPRCNSTHAWYAYDSNGDPALRRVYGTRAVPFHFWAITPVNYDRGRTAAQCRMAYGHRGPWVRILQMALNECYANINHRGMFNAVQLNFRPLREDGIFGPRTKAALVAAQRHHKIFDNGQYGPQTARTLNFRAIPSEGPWQGAMCHAMNAGR